MSQFPTPKAAASRLASPAPITAATARLAFQRLGMTLRKTEYGEFRINFRHGEEATAAYESDLPAAIDTGLAMLAHKARLARELRAIGCPARMAERDALTAVASAF